MFQAIMGIILLIFTAGLLIKYRPKAFLSWYFCLLCVSMAIISIAAGGGWWGLQLLQTVSQLVMATCSLFYLHREKVFAVRRAKARKEQQQAKAAAQQVGKPAAAQQDIIEIKHCA